MIFGRSLLKMIAKLDEDVSRHSKHDDVPADGVSYTSMRDLRRRCSYSQNYHHFSSDNSPPGDVPDGHLAVYVGRERRRFVIATRHLKHKLFKELLARSAEAFGFDYNGGLRFPCEVEHFENLLQLLNTHHLAANEKLDLDELFNFFSSQHHSDHNHLKIIYN